MQPTDPKQPASPIAMPDIDIDIDAGEVAVIPTASVAPLDGPPDGERIEIFTVAPNPEPRGLGETVLADLRTGAVRQPLTFALVAFSLGFVVGRLRG